MPKPVQDKTILRILREEWEARKAVLVEETKTPNESSKETSGNFSTVSPGLKLKSKSTGLLYTVQTVALGTTTVTSPEGVPSMLSNDTLEKEFELA
jgi:hypothetical protein